MIYILFVLVFVISLTLTAIKLEAWRKRQQSCVEFARIDDHLLHDIGLTQAQRFIAVNDSRADG